MPSHVVLCGELTKGLVNLREKPERHIEAGIFGEAAGNCIDVSSARQ